MAGVVGFEPTDAGFRVRSLTTWRYPNSTQITDVSGSHLRIRTLRLPDCRVALPYHLVIPQKKKTGTEDSYTKEFIFIVSGT